MNRLCPLLLFIVGISCAKPETTEPALSERQAMALAASRCQSSNLVWLQELIELADEDIKLKGSIYAIPVNSNVVFVHQPWISSCYACSIYSCDGSTITISDADRGEVIAGVSDENLIYTSF